MPARLTLDYPEDGAIAGPVGENSAETNSGTSMRISLTKSVN